MTSFLIVYILFCVVYVKTSVQFVKSLHSSHRCNCPCNPSYYYNWYYGFFLQWKWFYGYDYTLRWCLQIYSSTWTVQMSVSACPCICLLIWLYCNIFWKSYFNFVFPLKGDCFRVHVWRFVVRLKLFRGGFLTYMWIYGVITVL